MKFLLVLVVLCVGVVVSYDPACNQNGVIYADTRVCECFQCFSGSDCSQQQVPCVVEVTGGSPGLYQEYWYNDVVDVLQENPDYRSPYQEYIPYAPDSATNSSIPPGIHKVLVPEIQNVHAIYKNAVADGRWIVPAYGCTNLIAATAYAFSEMKRQETNDPDYMVKIYAKTPYYNGYPNMAYMFPGRMNFTSVEDYNDYDDIMEINTYPNNPTGDFHTATYPDAFQVHDSVYLWPSLVNYTEPLDADVVMFSMSKATGHAGSRFGWALVKDEHFANLMADYMERASLEISVDAQYRTLQILKDLVARPYDLFDYVSKVMEDRWDAALGSLARQPTRFAQSAVSGTFYMLVECLADGEKDNCYETFLNAGIMGEAGPNFGLSNAYLRLEMVPHAPEFKIFMQNLNAMTSS